LDNFFFFEKNWLYLIWVFKFKIVGIFKMPEFAFLFVENLEASLVDLKFFDP
jgi:hypothetical protein